ncbi:preprotein translocase subunit SecA [Arthrobacter sp. 131MFCol6.1]|uniref:preprotein translocase subunit SecA n=1 Tax=Arthrobacter sp. 131MFCol6.1 TaxID=1157944 RepID=UPI0012DC2B2D|nr:preprotein translocase subunit SecA [Arthrobacter sp. 131MFCol6.1]
MAVEAALVSGESDPGPAIRGSIAELVTDVRNVLAPFDPFRVIEMARIRCLPWNSGETEGASPETIFNAEGGPTRAELIALIASGGSVETPGGESGETSQPLEQTDGQEQSIGEALSNVLPSVERILQLAHLLQIAESEPDEPLAMLGAMMRGSELWVRNSSYPEMVVETLSQLFGTPEISQQLKADLGFDARDAVQVLDSCHELQVDRLNIRRRRLFEASELRDGVEVGVEVLVEAFEAWKDAFEPSVELVSVTIAEICEETNLPESVVTAVLDFFSFNPRDRSAHQLVDDFIAGINQLRSHPVMRSKSDAAMLVHGAHVLPAVRERLEKHLKATSAWELYQKHRGDLLERLTTAALRRVLDSATMWDGFEYYVPANEGEERGHHSRFSKRVEGDHLIIQDDVAIIVEDKAVAVSSRSRTGESRSLRRDLTGIITKASEQASRLKERIQCDGGLRIHKQGWLDLSNIREIHTIAVSLDDLLFASTATSELVRAGILKSDRIPWTVSIHDLDLITQLVDRPSEFLLYLRRRCNPEATVFYSAPDELDLFLYFLESGLYVEPDPDYVRSQMPFMPPATTAERRRRKTQAPAIITSRTEALDSWYAAQFAAKNGVSPTATGKVPIDGESGVVIPKPRMTHSPIGHLVDAIASRRDYGWLSVGATLLAGSSEFQEKLARMPSVILPVAASVGRERTVALPFGNSIEEGWLLVWCTSAPGQSAEAFERHIRQYLQLKKYQLGLQRGVAFFYDSESRQLADVFFDDHVGELEPELQQRVGRLRPIGDFDKLERPKKTLKR